MAFNLNNNKKNEPITSSLKSFWADLKTWLQKDDGRETYPMSYQNMNRAAIEKKKKSMETLEDQKNQELQSEALVKEEKAQELGTSRSTKTKKAKFDKAKSANLRKRKETKRTKLEAKQLAEKHMKNKEENLKKTSCENSHQNFDLKEEKFSSNTNLFNENNFFEERLECEFLTNSERNLVANQEKIEDKKEGTSISSSTDFVENEKVFSFKRKSEIPFYNCPGELKLHRKEENRGFTAYLSEPTKEVFHAEERKEVITGDVLTKIILLLQLIALSKKPIELASRVALVYGKKVFSRCRDLVSYLKKGTRSNRNSGCFFESQENYENFQENSGFSPESSLQFEQNYENFQEEYGFSPESSLQFEQNYEVEPNLEQDYARLNQDYAGLQQDYAKLQQDYDNLLNPRLYKELNEKYKEVNHKYRWYNKNDKAGEPEFTEGLKNILKVIVVSIICFLILYFARPKIVAIVKKLLTFIGTKYSSYLKKKEADRKRKTLERLQKIKLV